MYHPGTDHLLAHLQGSPVGRKSWWCFFSSLLFSSLSLAQSNNTCCTVSPHSGLAPVQYLKWTRMEVDSLRFSFQAVLACESHTVYSSLVPTRQQQGKIPMDKWRKPTSSEEEDYYLKFLPVPFEGFTFSTINSSAVFKKYDERARRRGNEDTTPQEERHCLLDTKSHLLFRKQEEIPTKDRLMVKMTSTTGQIVECILNSYVHKLPIECYSLVIRGFFQLLVMPMCYGLVVIWEE